MFPVKNKIYQISMFTPRISFSQSIYRKTYIPFFGQTQNICQTSVRNYNSAMTFPNETNSQTNQHAKYKKLWLIADMDETLLPKSMRELRSSPVWNPLHRLLLDKCVHLVIVTSDDAYRPFLIWDQLLAGEVNKEDLSNRIWVSTSQGCALFQRDKSRTIEHVPNYPTLRLDKKRTIELGQQIWLKFLREVRPWSNQAVLEKYPQWSANYRRMYWRMHRTLIEEVHLSKEDKKDSDDDNDDPPPVDDYHDKNTLKDYPKTIADLNLTEEDLLTPGFFSRSAVIWIAKLGPACYNEKFDLKTDPWGSAWLMHCPRPWSEEILASINDVTTSVSMNNNKNTSEVVQASAAPRSICFTCSAAEKSRTVEFFVESGIILENKENESSEASQDAVILLGDQPYGNDAALRALGDQGQFPFIGVTCVEDTSKILDKLELDRVLEAETQMVFVNYLRELITEVSPQASLYFSETKAML